MSTLHSDSKISESQTTAHVELPDLAPSAAGDAPFLKRQIELIRGVKVRVSVVLGEAEVNVGRLFDLRVGELLELDRRIGEPLELCVDGKAVARGELVVVGDSLGLKIVELAN